MTYQDSSVKFGSVGYGPDPEPYFAWEHRGGGIMHLDDSIKRAVVFVGAVDQARDIFTPMGTAFIVAVQFEGRFFQHIVTAKHVIDDLPNKIVIRTYTKSGEQIRIESKKSDWLMHPNPGKKVVDVAVLPIDLNPSRYDDSLHISIDDHVTAIANTIKMADIAAGEDVFLAGLFTTHYGHTKNLPVIRCGTLAAMPEEPLWSTWGYMDAYLIELRTLAGLSGSPVFVQIAPFRTIGSEKREIKASAGLHAQYLLGLVSGHYVIENTEDAIVDDGSRPKRGRQKRKPTGKINTGFALVVPVEKIKETIMQPKLIKMREDAIERLKRGSGFVADSVKITATNKLDGDEILRAALNTQPKPRLAPKAKAAKKRRG